MKLVIIIHHKLNNDLQNPTNQQLKSIGHDLSILYGKSKLIAVEYGLEQSQSFEEGTLENGVLVFLSRFAKQSRYYNLNMLAGQAAMTDPLAEWQKIHVQIADTYISYSKREKLNEKAISFADNNSAFGWERALDGEYIPNVDAIYLQALFKMSNSYCVWTLLRILRPFHTLLDRFCRETHIREVALGIDGPTVPYMEEFFPFFLCDLPTARGRKNWSKVCA